MRSEDPKSVRAGEIRSDKLVERLYDAINADPELTAGEIYVSIVGILGNMLFNTRCQGCRKAARQSIGEMMSDALQNAMVEAAKRDLADPSSDRHLH